MGTVRRLTHGGWQSLGFADSGAFQDRINAVRCDILKRFDRAIRPANFHRFHFLGCAQSEMQAQIVLRKITSAPVDFAKLLDASGANRYAGADRRAIALRANELEQNAVKSVRIPILEERGRLADVKQQNVDVAGVEDVTESRAAPRLQGQVLQPCLFRNFIKRAVAIITVQQERLAEAEPGFQRV